MINTMFPFVIEALGSLNKFLLYIMYSSIGLIYRTKMLHQLIIIKPFVILRVKLKIP